MGRTSLPSCELHNLHSPPVKVIILLPCVDSFLKYIYLITIGILFHPLSILQSHLLFRCWSGDAAGAIWIWDVQSRGVIDTRTTGKAGGVTCMELSVGDDMMWVGTGCGDVCQYRLSTFEVRVISICLYLLRCTFKFMTLIAFR